MKSVFFSLSLVSLLSILPVKAQQMDLPQNCSEEAVQVIFGKLVKKNSPKNNLKYAPAIKFLENCIKEKGLDPNIQSKEKGMTIAMYAILYYQPETARLLIEHDLFDPNKTNSKGFSLVFYAVEYQQPDLFKLIINHKDFNPNLQSNSGSNIFQYTLEEDPALAALIVDHENFDPNLTGSGELPNATFALSENAPELALKILRKKRFDPNKRAPGGRTFATVLIDKAKDFPEFLELQSTLHELMAKGALFEAPKVDFYSDPQGQVHINVSALDLLKIRGHHKLADQFKNSLRGDADPETACSEEQLLEHMTQIEDVEKISTCILCLENHSTTFRAHPKNENCHGICGSCHKDYLEYLASHGMTMNQLCCPSYHCQQPLSLSFLMSPHYASKREFPVTDIEQVKKITKIAHQRRICQLQGMTPCHKENCVGYLVKAPSDRDTWFKCPLCQGERFLGEDSDFDSATKALFQEGLKKGTHFPCPKCDSLIEKDGGCQHMTCKKCRHEFVVPFMQDFKKHCPNSHCQKMVTANSYQKEKLVEMKCPLCDHFFIWDEAQTFQAD